MAPRRRRRSPLRPPSSPGNLGRRRLPSSTDERGRTVETYSLDYSKVRAAVLDRLAAGHWSEALQSVGISARFDQWSGATETQAGKWLREGYRLHAAGNVQHGEVLTGTRRRMRWSDDGDLDVGQALAGADYPFARWDPRPARPGLAIVAELSFNSHVPAALIARYGDWLTRMIQRLEGEGYDLRASVVMPLSRLFVGQSDHRITDVVVNLKRENEATDFRNWSPMFSPMGFRVLGFTALYLMSVDLERTLTGGLGCAAGSGEWGVRFNPDTRTMRITVPSMRVEDFDPDRMTEQLLAALPEHGA